MRSPWRRAREAEARVAELEQAEEATQELVGSMLDDQREESEAMADALMEIRDGEHGHPRTAAGALVASGRCRVCTIVGEVL